MNHNEPQNKNLYIRNYLGQRCIHKGEHEYLIEAVSRGLYLNPVGEMQHGLIRPSSVKSDTVKFILRDFGQITEEETSYFGERFITPDYPDNPFWFEIEVKDGRIYYYKRPSDINNIEYILVDDQIGAADWATGHGFSIRNEFEEGLAIKER